MSFSICRAPMCHHCHVPPELLCHTQQLLYTPFLPQASGGLQSRRREVAHLPSLPTTRSSPASQRRHQFDVGSVSFLSFFPLPTTKSKTVSYLDADHLFKSTKHNLEYVEYGQHIFSLLYLMIFCFLTTPVFYL